LETARFFMNALNPSCETQYPFSFLFHFENSVFLVKVLINFQVVKGGVCKVILGTASLYTEGKRCKATRNFKKK
jgi:hypothetical protein